MIASRSPHRIARAVAASAPSASADGPLFLNPTTARSGNPLTVSGSCAPNTPVQTRLVDAGAATLSLKNGSGISNGTGNFSFNALVADDNDWLPAISPFTYDMVARCDSEFLESPFEVQLPLNEPASTGVLTLSDTMPDAGRTIQVTGPPLASFDETNDGFLPSQDIKIVMYPGAELLGTAVGTAAGLPSTSVTIPANATTGVKTIVGFGSYRTVAPSFTALTAAANVTGVDPPSYEPLTPARVLDTRSGIGRPGTVRVAAGGTVNLDVTGVGGVPASGVGSVILNVTVTGPTAGGWVTVHPGGEPRPTSSNLNYVSGQTIPNLVVAKVGAGGIVSLFSSASTHMVADVVGYFPTSS